MSYSPEVLTGGVTTTRPVVTNSALSSRRTLPAQFVDGDPKTTQNGKFSPETREWPDDIVVFDSATDPMNPKNWTVKRRYLIVLMYGSITMCSSFASSVFSPAGAYLSRTMGVSQEVGLLGISLFLVGYVFGPPWWTAISLFYGRKLSIMVPMFVFICLSAGTATAKDLQTVFVTRFFAGIMASAPVATVGGGLADLFDQRDRATAVVVYSLAIVAGPALGPIIGAAFVQSHLGWRWTEYIVVILTSVVLLNALLFLPETYAPVILTQKARALRLKTGRWALHSRLEMHDFQFGSFVEKNVTRPLQMMAFEPMVSCITLYNSFTYGILYLQFGALPIIYEEGRGWNSVVGALPLLASLSGSFTGAALNYFYSEYIYSPAFDRNGGKAIPEKRLIPMMLGAILFPIGFFILGWTSDPSIHWFPSMIGLYFVGMSFLLIFQAGVNFLIDAYTSESAAAIAANTLMRSLFAAALPLIARPMFHGMGVNWACTLLGCISIMLAGIPFLFYIYGPKLRSMSRLAKSSL